MPKFKVIEIKNYFQTSPYPKNPLNNLTFLSQKCLSGKMVILTSKEIWCKLPASSKKLPVICLPPFSMLHLLSSYTTNVKCVKFFFLLNKIYVQNTPTFFSLQSMPNPSHPFLSFSYLFPSFSFIRVRVLDGGCIQV